MDWWIWLGIAVLVVAFVGVAVRRGWIDLSDKTKRGGGGGTARARSRRAAAQSRLPAPAPLPGDGDKGIGISFADDGTSAEAPPATERFRGSIRLDVDRG